VKSLVVIPTFNERDNIAEVVDRLFAACRGCDLLVVDDSSPDGTGAFVEQLARSERRISLMSRSGKSGLGTAYIAGFRWGIERGYEAIVAMDADLSHDPAAVPALLEALEVNHADLAIGSRYVPGGGVSNWGRVRRALSRAGNAYARLWLRFDVRDATSGFRAYRSSVLEGMELSSFRAEGYAFQIETAWRTHQDGGRIVEVPITFEERHGGRSKLSRRIVFEALLRVPLWAVRGRLRR
jgi:glycosyltransferase involved in cell wall biosynthesis